MAKWDGERVSRTGGRRSSGRIKRFNRLFHDQLAELLPRVSDSGRRAGLDGLRNFDFVAYILAALRNAGYADVREREQAAHDVIVYLLVKSGRLTYSVITKTLIPEAMREFLLRELDRVGLPHTTFTTAALDLIVRSADGVLRHARNLCVGCLIDAVRSTRKTIDIDNVNRVLTQPHWQTSVEYKDY